MTQLVTVKRICEHLEKYVFDRVWNQPYSQFRSYVRPVLLNPVRRYPDEKDADGNIVKRGEIIDIAPITGFTSGRYSRILTPPYNSDEELADWLPKSSPKFFLYAIPADFFSTHKYDIQKWTLFSSFCTKNCEDLQMFTEDGILLNRGFIYIMQSDMNNCMLVAVESNMMLKLINNVVSKIPNVMFGKYHDSDSVADNVIASARMTTTYLPKTGYLESTKNMELPAGNGDKLALPDATFVLYNGKLCTGTYWRNFQIGGYVEAIKDDDVLGHFDVDAWSEDAPIYTDLVDEYGEDSTTPEESAKRLLIHIPKLLNPNYYLITPNTCDMWIVPLEGGGKSVDVNGVYLYPCKGGTHQITHNDFSIDYNLIKGIADAEGFTKYVIRVYVRTHNRQSVFIRDANYVDFLYNLTDEEITTFLLGKHDWQTKQNKLTFWSADHLEDCKYADALLRKRCKELNILNAEKEACKRDAYDKDACAVNQCRCCGLRAQCPNKELDETEPKITDHFCPYYTSRSIQDYIDILGYFHVLALIGKRVWHFNVLKEGTDSVVVYAPLALNPPEMQATDFYPIVYLNGVRVPQGAIKWQSTTSTNVDVEEIGHESADLDTANIIPMNYSVRLKIKLLPYYQETDHQLLSSNYVYYKLVDGEYRKAILLNGDESSEEYQSLTPEEKLVVDGFYGKRVDSYKQKFYLRMNDVHYGDHISVEVLDKRQDAVHLLMKMPGDISEVRSVHLHTYDQWAVYRLVETTNGSQTETVFVKVDDPGVFDTVSYVLSISPAWVETTETLLIVEGPQVFEDTIKFDITGGKGEFVNGKYTVTPGTVGYIGNNFYQSLADKTTGVTLDSDIAFLNDKRLIPELDYVTNKEWKGFAYTNLDGTKASYVTAVPIFCQNVSYLKESNQLDVIRTNTYVINQQRGFLTGDHITWEGQTPVWFDELSTLVIDGVLCSTYQQVMGKITLNGCTHRNGAPYEIKTSVSTLIKSILNYDEAMELDLTRIAQVREFFGETLNIPMMRTIIPHSHQLYSIYLEEIIKKYLTDESWDFKRLSECANKEEYLAQFSDFDYLKNYDVLLREDNPITEYDYGFVDSFAIYHPLVAKYREDYDKLNELVRTVLPNDPIKHKDVKK